MKTKRSQKLPCITHKHLIYGGPAMICRYRHCGDNFYFRMWIPNEKKILQHSLKTNDLDLAKQKAERDFIRIQGKVQSGEKLFSLTAEELREEFLSHTKSNLVDTGRLSKGRLANIGYQTKHYLEFVGVRERIHSIPPETFQDYVAFRRKEQKDIRFGTIRNEQITIASMYKWAVKRGLISINQSPVFERIKVPSDEGKREGISIQEYRRLCAVSRHWYKKANDASKQGELWYYRRLLHDFIVLQSNFGFRTGELYALRWEDVEIYKDGTARVYISAENSKVRKKRMVTSRRGDVFARIKSYSKYTAPQDFIFSSFYKNRQWNRQMLYRFFRLLVKEVRACYGDEFDAGRVLYGLRHLYISVKLLGGADPWAIARITGTSLRQITATYDDVKDDQVSKKLLSMNIRFDRDGNLVDRKGHEITLEGEDE